MQEEPPRSEPEPIEPESQDIDQSKQETEKSGGLSAHKHHWHRFKAWYATHKKWSIPLTGLILIIILAGAPWTRYNLAALVLKKNFTVQVTDSTAHIPVSGATVSVGPVSAVTNGSGKATLAGVKVGHRELSITKKYYRDTTVKEVIPILKQKDTPVAQLVATGRQAKIHVTNLITQKVLADVSIQIAGASAKTDSSGNALVVLPVTGTPQKAKLNLDGYNDTDQTVQVSNTSVKVNGFTLTPAGKVYFVSNRSGKIDVLKANLDGSAVQTVVAGTGSEDQYNTQIMESADGKYVAVVVRHSASDATPQLYVLATADDNLLPADNGDANFQLYGWVGDTLVYTVNRLDLPPGQQGVNKLKAYDAQTGSITLLDQSSKSTAEEYEAYSFIMPTANSVVYGKTLQGSNFSGAQHSSLQTIDIDGLNHQTLATYDDVNSVYFSQHGPDTVYIWQNNTVTQENTFTQYTAGATVKPVSTDSDHFYQGQNTYFYSASGKQTFWSEARDGKNVITVGDQDGLNPVMLTGGTDYQPYGWFTDQYLILSKDSNSLYVMSAKGGTPVKVSDYLSTGTYGY